MADSFQQRISLEGAEDIIKNLQQIGSEATKAIGQLKTAVTSANPALAALSTTSLAAQNALKGFGTAVGAASTAIAPFSASLSSVLGVFGAFAGPAGIVAAAAGLAVFTTNAATSIVAMDRQAKALGLTIEQFQVLIKVAKDAGISQEELAGGLTRLATQVSGQAQEQFKALIDVAKQVRTELGGTDIKIISLDQIQKLKETIASITPALKAQFAAAGDTGPASRSLDQINAKLLLLAQRADAGGEALRKSLGEAAAQSVAINAQEKLDALITKHEASLKSLGVSFLDAKGATVDEMTALLGIVNALQKIPEGAQRAAIAAKTLGRFIGPELAEALAKALPTVESIQEAIGKVKIDKAAVEEAKKLDAAMKRLEASAGGVKAALVFSLGPTLEGDLNRISKLIDNIKFAFKGDFVKIDFSSILDQLRNLNIAAAIGGAIARAFSSLVPDFGDFGRRIDERIKAAFAEFDLREFTAGIKDAFNSIDWSGIWDGMINALRTVGGRIKEGISDLVGAIKEEFSGISISTVLDGIVQGFTELPGRISGLFGTIDWSAIFFGIGTAVNTAIDAIVQAFTTLPGRIVGAISGLPGQIIGLFQGIVDTIVSLWDRVIQKIREAGSASASAPSLSDTGNVSGQARGGMIWGPGTGTSDSILARLSRGEFVIRAAAVQHYGPQLMAALNAMRLPRLPGFSLGGLADGLGRTLRANLAIPGMAAGGPTPAPAKANTVPITLDLRTDRGRFRGSAMADRDVAEALSRFAVLDQITSMGKKSGAY